MTSNIFGNVSVIEGPSTSSRTREIYLRSKNTILISPAGINLTNCILKYWFQIEVFRDFPRIF